MTSGAARAARSEAEQITSDRRELKYLMPGTGAASFVRSLAPLLARHRYSGAGANPLPRAQHYATTVYFDTADGDLYRAALTDSVHVKARAREYYDLHPDLTELATDPHDLVHHRPILWIELKVREGERSQKRRVAVPKTEVARLVERFEVTEAMRRMQPAGSTELEEMAAEFERLHGQFGKPLSASCVVNYRRLSWEDHDAALRITLDRDLSVFAATPAIWTYSEALTSDTLGRPVHQEPATILEVKSRGELPAWLGALLHAHAAVQAVDYSKFVMAARAVHGWRS